MNWEYIFYYMNINFSAWCGGHSAESCEKCVFDAGGALQGSGWCNGDCIWNPDTNKCVNKIS